MSAPCFHIVNLGCKVNRVESDSCAVQLLQYGWCAGDLSDADLIIINTCTVTGEADKKTRKTVRHAASNNNHAKILVTGCAAQITPEVFEEMSEQVFVVPKAKLKNEIDELIKTFDLAKLNCNVILDHPFPLGKNFHTRVGVKIQDGCNNACTYCIVHVARGRAWSRPADEVIDECVALHRAGVREIVLTGINLGSYSYLQDTQSDDFSRPGDYQCAGSLQSKCLPAQESRSNKSQSGVLRSDNCAPSSANSVNLTQLLEQLLHATKGIDNSGAPLTRFRISSIEPADVTDDLLQLMQSANGRIARHLHLPLQSGSTKVLREMARPYTAEQFEQLVKKIREICPIIALSTDVIAGFPGETLEDFQETIDVCKRSRFMKLHVFPYSMREGTPAATRADQVSPQTKNKRAKILRNLSCELATADLARRAGTREFALVETNNKATAESYHEIAVSDSYKVGSLIEVGL